LLSHLTAAKARVQERTACCEVPDIIWPVIDTGLPVIAAVKFDDPSLRTAVTSTRALHTVEKGRRSGLSRPGQG
jgi:hypothetical protein